MRVKLLAVGLLLFVVIVLFAAQGWLSPAHLAPIVRTPDGTIVSVEIADTESKRVRGLGGRRELGAREGMLFAFPRSGYHGMWMKDMRFSLDIVWFRMARTNVACARDNAGEGVCLEVVDVREHVAPETFPAVLYPREPAHYVLEVNAGIARGAGIQRGGTLLFAH